MFYEHINAGIICLFIIPFHSSFFDIEKFGLLGNIYLILAFCYLFCYSIVTDKRNTRLPVSDNLVKHKLKIGCYGRVFGGIGRFGVSRTRGAIAPQTSDHSGSSVHSGRAGSSPASRTMSPPELFGSGGFSFPGGCRRHEKSCTFSASYYIIVVCVGASRSPGRE